MREPKVGDVYPAKASGPASYRRRTKWWLVVAVTPGRPLYKDVPAKYQVCHLLGLDAAGRIVSTTTYGTWTLQQRPLAGRIRLAEETIGTAIARLAPPERVKAEGSARKV